MYAGRKRRKPAQRGVKPVPTEGTKTNPSKRHRDRLNSELDRLASLLPFPEEVISSLDKLSILRLSVSYLRTKSFFSEALKHQPPNGISKNSDGDGGGMTPGAAEGGISEGELLLQALNGFVLVVTSEGNIFFCSHTIQDYLGFHQTDVMHQSVFELIHTEDQQEFKRNLHWALNPPVSLEPPTDPAGEELTSSCPVSYNPDQLPPENSSFLERAFVCRFRCLLDNSSGFLPLSIQGRLKFLHGQSRQSGSSPPQLALFAVATPLQPPAILEIRTKNMIFRTKHKLDFTPMACDAKGKIVLGYTEAELRVRGSGYQFIHAADMLYCAENHIRMIKTGESGLTVFRLLTKDNRWKWVQANARLVYKNGKPDYIIATQRPLAEEEGGEHLRKRSMHLPFTFATGEALLYQTSHPLHGFPDSSHGKARGSKSNKGKVDKSSSDELKPNSLLGALMSQDESVYVCQPDAESRTLYHGSRPAESDSLLNSLDPLLSTLDSLSLDGGETCSNSELFSALESLGLNADDLELLLLDERMMQVELDPNHVPTLTDLLTNNEILTYVHDTLQSEMENEVPSSDPDSAPQQPCLIPEVPLDPPTFRQPIVQLSQQMQQHIQAASHPAVVENPAGLSDSLWVDHHLQTTLSGPQLDAEHLNPHLESPWQLQINPENTASSSFLNGSYQNQNMTFPLSLDVSLPDYTLDSCTTLLNGEATLDVHQHQGGMTTAATPAHLGQQKQNPPSRHPSIPALFSLLCYSSGSVAVAERKILVENGCLLNVANVGYVRTCLIPGRNGVEAVTGPDEVSNLQDPQKSGFFL
uniref:Aryl hydrocarbon receptor 1b n=1 Tax=Poecilia reticulata TaxID=8081 RepID=A0A3P9QC01_POERE